MIDDYIVNGEVVSQITSLKQHLNETKLNVSDTRDNNGFQYVDLVQEGGGVLGIALVGYTYALEQAGIRFASLAGTSAGAINTAFLAATGTPDQAKSLSILSILENTNLASFVDGGYEAEIFINNLIGKRSKASTIFKSIPILTELLIDNDLGINPGKVFTKWLEQHFLENGISTTEQLLDRMNQFPEELLEKSSNERFDLAIVAGDITTHTKAVFPKMAHLYFKDPSKVNPVQFVRASMSIPLFFEPLVIRDIPNGIEHIENWQDIKYGAGFFGDIPKEITFVDGGIMSNFPIDVFHRNDKVPTRPTFGVKLGLDRVESANNDSILKVAINSFNAARQMRDQEVLLKNKDFNKLIAFIDVKDFNWIDFNMGKEEKIDLFKMGVKAGCEFVKNFDWKQYKELRSDLLEINKY